jgi:hypothetical protein
VVLVPAFLGRQALHRDAMAAAGTDADLDRVQRPALAALHDQIEELDGRCAGIAAAQADRCIERGAGIGLWRRVTVATRRWRKCLVLMVGGTGFEPVTPAV